MKLGRRRSDLTRLRENADRPLGQWLRGGSLLPSAGNPAKVARYVSIPLIYVALASLYVVGSTLLAAFWFDYGSGVYLAEIVKGIGFIAATALLLFAVLFREARSDRLEELTFRGLVENLPDAVFVLELPARRIIYANPGAERMFGYARAELVGRTTEVLHVGNRAFGEFDTRGRGDLAEQGSYLGEFMMRRKDGRAFPTSHMVALITDGAGRQYSVSVVRDEIERVAQQAELRESEERLRRITENLREIVWITNAERTRIQYVSPAYEEIWGRPLAELYENPNAFLSAVHPDDRDWVEPQVTASPPRDHDIEYRILCPDGAVRWISDRAVVVRDRNGRAQCVVGIAEDITRRRQQQSELLQAQKMDVLGQLAGGITHDFNNLLTVVLGNAESLAADSGEGPVRAELEDIIVASRQAIALSKRLLGFSRRSEISRKAVDCNDLIAETCRWLDRTIGRSVTIELALADGLWPVLADRSELQLCVVNLAVNARDAMPGGGIVHIATRNVRAGEFIGRDLDPGDYVVLAVRDGGSGLSPEIRERIFEPFFTTKPPGRGTGLGLSIVRECVTDCGGSMRVHSRPARGSTFEIWLPRYLSAGTEAGDAEDAAGAYYAAEQS